MCFHILYCMGPTNWPAHTSVSTSAGGTKLTWDLLWQNGREEGMTEWWIAECHISVRIMKMDLCAEMPSVHIHRTNEVWGKQLVWWNTCLFTRSWISCNEKDSLGKFVYICQKRMVGKAVFVWTPKMQIAKLPCGVHSYLLTNALTAFCPSTFKWEIDFDLQKEASQLFSQSVPIIDQISAGEEAHNS